MHTWQIVVIVAVVVVIAVLAALYFFGSKLQKKQEANQKEMEENSQSISMLIIDKKRMKLKEAGFPQLVIDQTPKYLRNNKVPVVKAKIGPRITNLMCDDKVFELIPVKKEVKAVVSGIYIMNVKGLRTGLEQKPQKVGFFKRITKKITKK